MEGFKLIRCLHNNDLHKDCFARTEFNECEALSDCRWISGICPFYKSRAQQEEECRKINERLGCGNGRI